MKRYYTLLLLLTGLLISSHSEAQGSLAALDSKNGFRDVKFGTPLSSFKGMVFKEPGFPLYNDFYKRKSDKLVIGDIPLNSIEYIFQLKRLKAVPVSFAFKYNDLIYKTLVSAYGKPQEGSKERICHWRAKTINIIFFTGHENASGYFTISSDAGDAFYQKFLKTEEAALLNKNKGLINKRVNDL